MPSSPPQQQTGRVTHWKNLFPLKSPSLRKDKSLGQQPIISVSSIAAKTKTTVAMCLGSALIEEPNPAESFKVKGALCAWLQGEASFLPPALSTSASVRGELIPASFLSRYLQSSSGHGSTSQIFVNKQMELPGPQVGSLDREFTQYSEFWIFTQYFLSFLDGGGIENPSPSLPGTAHPNADPGQENLPHFSLLLKQENV